MGFVVAWTRAWRVPGKSRRFGRKHPYLLVHPVPGFPPRSPTPDSVAHGTTSFRWVWQSEAALTSSPAGRAVAESDDGTVIAGTNHNNALNADEAAIWTQANGWQGIDWLPFVLSCSSCSSAYGVSGDGTMGVGHSWNGCDGRGFRWTAATGMKELQAAPRFQPKPLHGLCARRIRARRLRAGHLRAHAGLLDAEPFGSRDSPGHPG